MRQISSIRLRIGKPTNSFGRMLPYPHSPASVRTAFCFRENAQVRMKHQCWTCSWRRLGSEALADTAIEPQHCALIELKARVHSVVLPRRAA